MRNLYNIELGLERVKDRIKHADINKTDKDYIKKYDQLQYIKGVGSCRRKKCLAVLLEIAKVFNKNFKKVTQEDIVEYLEYLDGREIKEITKADHKKILKAFYNYLYDNNPPIYIKEIKTTFRADTEKEVLTEEEITTLRDIRIKDTKDKAFLEVLCESGCRLAEILNLEPEDAIFDKLGAILKVNGKTGCRPVRIIRSTKYIKKAIEQNTDEYIFNNSAKYYEDKVKFWASIAGIEKNVTPHLFRHSMTTILKLHNVPLDIIRKQQGWSKFSRVPDLEYTHITQDNVDDALMELYKG